MPKGKSIYETYFDPGASTGKYASSLQKVSDVWANIDFSREKSAWETERRERNLDTLLAVTELGATVGGSMVGFEEGSAAISKKTGMEADSEPLKIGRGGEEWESLSGFEKLWQSPRFKFGDDTIMSKSEIRKYGRDVKEYGKYGVDLPLDVYQGKSMHAEYREGYDKEKYWHPGKYAGKALGVAEKVGQTIVPGGEVGYKDLYSGLGKKASDAVQTQEKKDVDIQLDPTGQAITNPVLNIPSIIQDEPEYVYEEEEGAEGSKGWFEGVLKTYQSKNMAPLFGGTLEKYNPQFQILAKERGWTGSEWK